MLGRCMDLLYVCIPLCLLVGASAGRVTRWRVCPSSRAVVHSSDGEKGGNERERG